MNVAPASAQIDLDACAAEPIRIPGAIQPHGALLVLHPDRPEVLHVSANAAEIVGLAVQPGDLLDDVAGTDDLRAEIAAWRARGEATLLRTVAVNGRSLQVSGARTPQGRLVEFEAPPQSQAETLEFLYPRLRRFLGDVAAASDVRGMAVLAAREIRSLTGFNRVLLYSFDDQGVGTVLAEDTDDVLPSYLNLKFPGSDIPAQARELYKLNRIRLIPDADYRPAPVTPATSPIDGRPLDLGLAALRSVSPVHLEYMRNMGTASSMSISLIVEGRLWGLISGHSRNPLRVNAQVRAACDNLGHILSLQIEAREQARRTAERLQFREVQTDLLSRLAHAPSYQTGLAEAADRWRAIANAAGAAIVTEQGVLAVGAAPAKAEIEQLAARLWETREQETAIDSLAARWPDCEAFAATASGLLAISVSQIHPYYMMWFRPEAVREVQWAGEPHKPTERGDRLHPRKSFQLWKEQVRLRSTPWTAEEVDSAVSFRGAIQNFVLRRAEERAELTSRLTEINKELESFSYSISHDLRAPFRHVVGYAELLSDRTGATLDETSQHYLKSISEAALAAGRLVDDLLNFSQLGRSSLRCSRVDMAKLALEIRRSLEPELIGRNIEWTVGPLPPAWADAAMIRQVLQNLIQNAIKYTAPRQIARISIAGTELGDGTVYTVSDNGVGFDQAYVHKLFQVFQRLHRSEDFEGTGIGLALVRRIVERHGGAVGASGFVGSGAEFTFTLPKRQMAPSPGDDTLG